MPEGLPASPGSYVLVLEASTRRRVRVGAAGALEIEPGFYAYVGSARGPGGLAARVAHHRRRAASPHWHVDYLRRHAELREVWFVVGTANQEHRFAEVLAGSASASVPLPGFGASDCRCRAHLFRFSRRPRVSTFRRRLVAAAAPAEVAFLPEVARFVALPASAGAKRARAPRGPRPS